MAFCSGSQQNAHIIRHSLAFLISLALGLLWVVALGFVGKRFGIPAPTEFQQREGMLRRLSFTQYVCFYGALGWGIAIFVANFADDYLQGKLLGDVAHHASPAWAAVSLIWWLGSGSLCGWMTPQTLSATGQGHLQCRAELRSKTGRPAPSQRRRRVDRRQNRFHRAVKHSPSFPFTPAVPLPPLLRVRGR